MTTPESIPKVRPRLPWVDTVRAMAVSAVVLFHVSLWHFVPFTALDTGSASAGVVQVWDKVNGVINGIRMPVLLALSGLLVGRRIADGFAAIRRSVQTNFYLYAVWLSVYALLSLIYVKGVPHRVESPLHYLSQFLVPDTPLWYVMALALYSLLLAALRRAPTWLVLSALGVVSVAVMVAPFELGLWRKIVSLAIFFALGVRGGVPLRWIAEHASALMAALAVITTLALIYCDRFVDGTFLYRPFGLMRNVIVVFAAVALVSWAVRWRPLARVGSFVGQRTLPVYVLHVIVIQIIVLATLTLPIGRWSSLLAHPAGALIYPVALTVVIIAITIALGGLLKRSGATFLFGLPPADARVSQRGPRSARK